MGIQERKRKHKEDLKQLILDAAKKLFMKDGYEATSIRKIAAEIEFSPTTIYLYYKDKAEISHALHQEGFKILGQQLSILSVIQDPFERLKAMGKVYMQFAFEHGDFYELMFMIKDPLQTINECADNHWEEGQQAFRLLLSGIEACQAAGYFRSLDPETFSLLVWSTMHGLCALQLKGHLDMVVAHKNILQNVDNVLEHTFETFIKMLEQLR